MTTFLDFTWVIFVLLFIGNGLFLKYSPPKRRSWWYGGTTIPTSTNEEAWKEALRFVAMPQIFIGIGFLVYALIFIIIKGEGPPAISLLFLMVAAAVILKRVTMKHLDKLFDENGNRKLPL